MKYLFAIAVLLLAACAWAIGDAASDERELTQLVKDLNAAIAKPDIAFLERDPGQGLRPLPPARHRREPGALPGESQDRPRGFRLAGRG